MIINEKTYENVTIHGLPRKSRIFREPGGWLQELGSCKGHDQRVMRSNRRLRLSKGRTRT